MAAGFACRVPHHSHSLGLIQIYLRVVLNCAVGFRGAAAVLQVAALLFPTDEQGPSPNGGQMWLLRLGLYMLSRRKEQADDWVWIIDHTIQIGPLKCLVVVGVRLSDWEAKRVDEEQSSALAHHDLSVLLIKPMAHSDGEIVRDELVRLSQTSGIVPCEIVSDCGADLEKGINLFCRDRATRRVKDIAHAAANAVKHELNGNAQWEAFLREASHAKAKMRQTKFAFLLPPELKAKARWMNLDALVAWSRKAIDFVQSPRPVPGVSWEDDELEKTMGWIRGYQEPLAAWSQMLEVVAAILTYAREHGYHSGANQELQAALSSFVAQVDTPACSVAERLLAFVENESTGIAEGRRLVASSEVLESLIGKAKQLEGRQSKGGFTKTVLGLAASVAKVTEENVRAALTATKVQDVFNWVREHLGVSLEAQRYHAFKPRPPGTKLASTAAGAVS